MPPWNSLERISPDHIVTNEITGSQTLKLHLQRYHYAAQFLIPGNVADIACGTGYGSYLLATQYGEKINRIIAADIDVSVVDYAKTRYQHPKINFIVAEATKFESSVPLHNIVSLETIEHLKDPVHFIENISGQLLTGGRFITSVPVTPSMDANPYHLHDFTRKSFLKLFRGTGFKKMNSFIQVQSYDPFFVINKNEVRAGEIRKSLLNYYIKNPGKFFLRIRSLLSDGFCNKYLVAVFEKL